MQGSNLEIWMQSLRNEWGCLAQGNNNGVLATDTVDFIHKEEGPQNRDITYAKFVLDYCPLKSKPHPICINVGVDKSTIMQTQEHQWLTCSKQKF